MRSLKSAFAEETPAPKQAQSLKDRANLRLAAHRWSRRQRQALGVLILSLILGGIIALVWADRSGRLDFLRLKTGLWMENRLAAQGLYARDVTISGHGFTSLDEVRAALNAYDREPLSRLSPARVAQDLEALPWVSSATGSGFGPIRSISL